MASISESNQRAYWNSDPGARWAKHQSTMDTLMSAVTDLLLDVAAPQRGEHALDIGCGAGASAFALARAVEPGGHVLGIDISEPLLKRAGSLHREAGVANVAFASGDAAAFDFPAPPFDLAISRFGVMFFEDSIAAFRHIGGALRPGGRMILAAWAGTDLNPWFAQQLAATHVRFGPPASPPDPHAPGPMAFSDIARVVSILEAAGLDDCVGAARTVELHHPGGVEAVGRLGTEIGPAARLIADNGSDPVDIAAIADDIAARFQPYAGPDGVRVPATINVFSATRR